MDNVPGRPSGPVGIRLAAHGEAIGPASATEAEYRALLAGLGHGLGRVSARSDLRLVVAHVNGERHIGNPRLLALEVDITDTCRRNRHRAAEVDPRGRQRGGA